MPVSNANPFTKNIAVVMVAAAKEVGFEIVEWENQAQPSQWVHGINFATNEKFDLIDLLGGVDRRHHRQDIALLRSDAARNV